MEPSAVPATGGAAPLTPATPGGTGGGLFGDDPTPPPEPGSTTGGGDMPPAGGIFGGDGGTSKPRTALSNPATSPLNLIGKIESWGIGPATKVAEVSIKVSTATGAQLKELLKRLPDGMTFELSLEKEDN